MTVTLTASPSPRPGRAPSGKLRRATGPGSRKRARSLARSVSRSRHSGPKLSARCSRSAPRQARRRAAGRGRQEQVALADDGRDMEVAKRQDVLDIDQHAQGPGPAGQMARLAFRQARHEQKLERRQDLV